MGDVATALDEAGIGNIPGLLEAVEKVAPTAAALRAMSDADLDGLVMSLFEKKA